MKTLSAKTFIYLLHPRTLSVVPIKTIFISDNESDDEFVGWGEDGKAMYELD